MQIIPSPLFRRSYKKLPTWLKERAKEREVIFRDNPFNSILKTHKLHGEFKDFWSFSVSNTHRVLFKFTGEKVVIFINIGDHDIYK